MYQVHTHVWCTSMVRQDVLRPHLVIKVCMSNFVSSILSMVRRLWLMSAWLSSHTAYVNSTKEELTADITTINTSRSSSE